MSELAPIPLLEPLLGGREREYLDACVTTNFVSSVGPFVERFEREFAAYVGARFAVCCASGTAALHVALHMLDLQPDDEVFVSTLTFIASANPVLYERARPVLVDAERRSWNMDAARVVDEIERRARNGLRMPRAIEAVHILGHPAEMESLVSLCERHGIMLIEDAAESLGARYTSGRFAGKQVGTLGAMGCFSFNGNKVITTGGGGMITSDDEAHAKRAKHLTTQARLPGLEYRHDEPGFNYRMTNVAAALGLAQLEQLPSFLERKARIAARYDALVAELAGVHAPPRPAGALPSHWLYTVRIDPAVFGCDRHAVLDHLSKHGIYARPVWTPLHLMAPFRDAARLGGEVAEELFSQCVSLPSSVHLTEEQQVRVVSTLASAARR